MHRDLLSALEVYVILEKELKEAEATIQKLHMRCTELHYQMKDVQKEIDELRFNNIWEIKPEKSPPIYHE